MSVDGMQGAMPPGSVIITPTQMYAEIRVMSGKVDHLASVLDPALTTIRQDMTALAAQNLASSTEARRVQTDFETRLRSLDKRVWIAAVVAAGSGVGISQIIAAIGGLT